MKPWMLVKLIAPLGLLFCSLPIFAEEESQVVAVEPVAEVADVEEKVEEKKDPNKIICRSERGTGSYISRKKCRTRAQIDAEAEAAQEALREANNNAGRGADADG